MQLVTSLYDCYYVGNPAYCSGVYYQSLFLLEESPSFEVYAACIDTLNDMDFL